MILSGYLEDDIIIKTPRWKYLQLQIKLFILISNSKMKEK